MVWHFSWLLMECVVTQNGTCFILPKVSYAIIVAIYSQGRLDITNIYKYRIWIQMHIASYSSSCSHHFSLSCLSFKPIKPYFDRPGTGQPQPPTFLAESPADPLPSCFQRMHSTRRCHSLVLLMTLEHIIYEGVVASLVNNKKCGLPLQKISKTCTHQFYENLWNISPCFSKIVLRTNQLITNLDQQGCDVLPPLATKFGKALIFMDTDSVVNRHQQQQLPVNLKNEVNHKKVTNHPSESLHSDKKRNIPDAGAFSLANAILIGHWAHTNDW